MTAPRDLLRALLGGVVASTIDIGAACAIYRRSIPFILQSIAGGLLAERAFYGGAWTAWLGLLLQEGMGVLIATIYILATRRWERVQTRWVAGGMLYGLVIFGVMNFIVVPLSAWRRFPVVTPYWVSANLAAMCLFGLIVAYFAGVGGRSAGACASDQSLPESR